MDKTIKIWDVDTGTVKRTLAGHIGGVLVLAVLENGYLVSGSADKTIKIWKIWNVEDGTLIKTLTGHTKSVDALVVLNNGDLVSGSHDKIKIWDVENETIKKDIKVDSKVYALVVLPNGDLVSALKDSIQIWV